MHYQTTTKEKAVEQFYQEAQSNYHIISFAPQNPHIQEAITKHIAANNVKLPSFVNKYYGCIEAENSDLQGDSCSNAAINFMNNVLRAHPGEDIYNFIYDEMSKLSFYALTEIFIGLDEILNTHHAIRMKDNSTTKSLLISMLSSSIFLLAYDLDSVSSENLFNKRNFERLYLILNAEQAEAIAKIHLPKLHKENRLNQQTFTEILKQDFRRKSTSSYGAEDNANLSNKITSSVSITNSSSLFGLKTSRHTSNDKLSSKDELSGKNQSPPSIIVTPVADSSSTAAMSPQQIR